MSNERNRGADRLVRSTARGLSLVMVFSFLCLASPSFALGQKESPREPATGLNDWEHDFDISSLSPGLYNIVVTGTDVAGNAALGGPINVYVDPRSDLPIVSVINPTPLQRVGGDLNIVGACVDDDGVARVEVSVDGGDFVPATGGEFWSLYLKTKDLQDGRRELAIRGVDINGLVGPTVKVAFNLDRSKPAADVSVPEPGALVAGQIKLEGSVYDANGVAGLELSTDGGKVFSKVSMKKDKPGTTGAFSVALDTRKFPDGPRVLWLRSVDGVGSKGSAAFLIFVDNTKPVIDIALPRTGATVNGVFAVAGAVRDAVGIAKLSYEFAGTDKGEIPLVPGNPYFSKEFDASAVKGDKAQLILIAEDRIGNITRLELSPKIDREADKPRVVVAFPASGGVVKTAEAVWGAIADDDGGAAIVYSLDGGAVQEAPASDVFSIPVAGLSAGRHLLSLRAKDIHGALGDPISLPIVVDSGRASVSFLRVATPQAQKQGAAPAPTTQAGAADYRPGMAFQVDDSSSLEGAIESANALVSASYTVAGGAERPLALVKGATATSYSFRIPLDRSMPYGFTAIEVKAVDAVGNTGSGRALLYSIDLSVAREDTGFVFDDPRIGEGGRVALSSGDSVLGAFYREDIDSIRLDPATDIVAVSFEGRTVMIKAAREGVSPATRLVVKTKRGHEFRSDPFVFACDTAAPRISIDSPAEGTWLSSAFVLKGKIADAGGVASASLRIGKDGEPRALALSADGSFSASLAPADLPQGALLVEVLATDASGNTSRVERSLGFDSEAPAFSFLSPTAGAEVHGPEDVAAILSDVSGIVSVEYAADGRTFAPIEFKGEAFIHRADLAANPKAAYRVTDRAGNSAVARPEVAIVAKPVAIAVSDSVSVDTADSGVKLSLSGTAGTRKVSLALPGLPEADFQGLGFTDKEGEAGAFKAAPERFALHLLVSGSLALKGSVASTASVKSVSVSFDGGATYTSLFLAKDAKAIVAEAPVSLAVDTTKLKDGEARWILKVEDGAGALAFAPLYIVVDNGKPDISLIAPPTSLTGARPIVARVLDAWGLASAGFTVAGQKKELPVAEGGSFHAAWAEPAQPAAAGGAASAKPQPFAVSLEARDAAGNAASLSVPIPYDAAADTPKIDLSIPTAAPASAPAAAAATAPAFIPPQERITCYAVDDDPAPVLRFTVDSGEPVSFPTSAFGLALAGLAPGKHSLQVEALDAGGRSAVVKKDFVVSGPAPAFDAIEAGTPAASLPWFPGMELEIVQGTALSGTVNAANGLASLEYSVNGGPPAKAVIDKSGNAFSCPFPAGLAYDRVTVELRARDLAGLETLRRYNFHNILEAAAGAPPADTSDAIRFFDPAIGDTELPAMVAAAGAPAAPATPAPGGASGTARLPVLLLAPGASVEGFWNGRPLRNLVVESAGGTGGASAPAVAASLQASWDGGQIKLTAAAETIVSGKGLMLRAETVDGDRFEWGPFVLAIDAAAPNLSVDVPATDSYEKGSVRIAGRAEDANGIVAVEVSVNGGAFTPIPAAVAPQAPAASSATASPTAPAAGPAAGKPGSAPAAASKPVAAATKPAAAGAATAAAPAPAPVAVPAGPAKVYPFDMSLPLAAAEDGAVRLDIVARDAAGKETHVLRYITKDTVAPALTQVLPAPGESVNGTTTFIGEAIDAGRVASINFLAGPGPNKDSPAPTPEPVSGVPVFAHVIDLAKTAFPLPEGAGFVVADKAGNVSILQPQIVVDLEKDKPVVEIQSPSELEVLRANYVISGAVYDDDGVAALYYRIDGGDWAKVDVKGASFSIPKTLAESVDNEHLVEAYAEDIYGVKSDIASRRFRISKEEPTALMSAPSIDKPVRGSITLSGSAQDANGIASVAVSFDNGASWEMAAGAESWSYPLDTKILKDGLHPIALRPLDKYDTEGFYATFLSVDNTPPTVEISLPADGVAYSGTMPLSGRVSDNVRLAEVRLEIAPIGNGKPPLLSIPLDLGPVIGKDVDLSSLPAGAYTVRLVARDRADNETFASRDIVVRLDKPEDRVELLFPVQGDEASGKLRVYGRAVIAGGASSATILVDGADVGTAPLDHLGYFAFDIPAEKLAAGQRAIMARAMGADGKAVSSQVATLSWAAEGPWVTVDSLNAGAYVPERPWLSGHAGWMVAAPDPKDAAATAAFKKGAAARKVALVEVSLDNGRTWEKARGGEAWKFRLETQNYPEGGLHVIVRAHYGDGSTRTAKTVLSLDKTQPEVRLLEPLENGRFNGVIHVAGAASDESGLSSVGLSLRKGDKRGYELPAFIQGLYLDGHAYGATYWDVGAGLSFFQDNVKLQVMFGQAPSDGRFGGDVFGAKLLANIFYLPASFIFGPDWSFLSASFAVGANFSYFSTSTSGQGLVLGAVVAQVEFPKFTIKDWAFMRKISFYTEGQAWFVSSDVQGGIELRMAFGVRLGLF